MGLITIDDEILQGIKNIGHSENIPVEDLIKTAILFYKRCWENDKRKKISVQGRRYDRQNTDWDDNLFFQFAEGDSDQKIPGKLKDISTNGVSFSFEDQHSVQEVLSVCSQTVLLVSFKNPKDDQTIQFRMTPKHIRKEGEENIVGLAFADDNCDYNDFVTFLNLVEQQPKDENSDWL